MAEQRETWLGVDRRVKPLVQAGLLLGLGIGGFFDGIVLHQILQWHHMLSSHPDPDIARDLPLNVAADGFFHVATYAFTIAGIAFLWRAWRRPAVPPSGRTLLGSIVIGWGLFNLVEGVVDHHLLGIHHVWPEGPGSVLLWDLGFLLWGITFLLGGYAIVRGDDAATPTGER